jgi:hypothetical protein
MTAFLKKDSVQDLVVYAIRIALDSVLGHRDYNYCISENVRGQNHVNTNA